VMLVAVLVPSGRAAMRAAREPAAEGLSAGA
jgi:hypothetical protein